jgi:tetratricopeptide (TPR) repeat protein
LILERLRPIRSDFRNGFDPITTTMRPPMTSGSGAFPQGGLAEAEAGYRRTLAGDPDDAGAWTNLGVVLQLQGRLDPAEACYRRALTLRPDQAETHNNLGVVLQAQDRLDPAAACFERALALKPDYLEALNGLGVAHQARGRLDQAAACFRRVLALKPDHAEAHTNLATALLQAGDLEAGFCELEWRWRVQDRTDRLPELPQPLWTGDDLSGRTLLVLPEQGAGDTVQFLRFLAPLKARTGVRRVVFLAPDALARLLAPVAGIDRLVVAGDPPPAFDCHVPLLSLPHRLGTGNDTLAAAIPYLQAPEPQREARRRQLAGWPGLKVGVVWHGNPRQHNNRKRSLPGQVWALLGRRPGIQWFSLQPGPSAEEARLLSEAGAVDLGPSLTDWSETAAWIAALDLVITVDTGVANLAGALGKPAWVLLSFAPDWRWRLGCDRTPWYPSLRLFRQPQPGDWAAVLEAVIARLDDWAAGRAPP